MNKQLRDARALVKIQVQAQRDLDESRERIARWNAIAAIGSSVAQASVANPMWSSATIALAGAVLATIGKAVDLADPQGRLGNVQLPVKTVGYGMMGFAGAKATGDIVAQEISAIAAAFRGGTQSQATSLAFDVPYGDRGVAGGASVTTAPATTFRLVSPSGEDGSPS